MCGPMLNYNMEKKIYCPVCDTLYSSVKNINCDHYLGYIKNDKFKSNNLIFKKEIRKLFLEHFLDDNLKEEYEKMSDKKIFEKEGDFVLDILSHAEDIDYHFYMNRNDTEYYLIYSNEPYLYS